MSETTTSRDRKKFPAAVKGNGKVATVGEDATGARSRQLLMAMMAFRDGDFSVRLPADWPGFRLRYRYGETFYSIAVSRGDTPLTVDGVEQPDQTISLVDDRQEHSVEVRIRTAQPERLRPAISA